MGASGVWMRSRGGEERGHLLHSHIKTLCVRLMMSKEPALHSHTESHFYNISFFFFFCWGWRCSHNGKTNKKKGRHWACRGQRVWLGVTAVWISLKLLFTSSLPKSMAGVQSDLRAEGWEPQRCRVMEGERGRERAGEGEGEVQGSTWKPLYGRLNTASHLPNTTCLFPVEEKIKTWDLVKTQVKKKKNWPSDLEMIFLHGQWFTPTAESDKKNKNKTHINIVHESLISAGIITRH